MSETLADLVVSLSADFGDTSSQIAALGEQLLGAQNVTNDVAASFQGLGDQLTSLGSNLAEPLAAAAVGMDGFAGAAQEAVDPLASLSEESIYSSEHLTELGESAEGTSAALSTAGDAAEHAGSEAGDASEGFGKLFTKLLEFAGIALTLEGLKEAVTEAFSAFSQEERATEALTALTGSSDKAETAIVNLKSEAQRLGLPIEETIQAAQKMAAFGFSMEAIPGLLESAANASRATTNDFGAVANSIDRMVISGTAGSRQLALLGISLTDLGVALGVTTSQAAAAFKALDVSDRVAAIQGALSKYAGMAETTANDLAGTWQKFKNEVTEDFEEAGAAMAPLAKAALEVAVAIVAPIDALTSALRKELDVQKQSAATLGSQYVAAYQLAAAYPELTAKLRLADQQYDQGIISAKQYADAIKDVADAAQSATKQTSAGAISLDSAKAAGVIATTKALQQAVKEADAALRTAATTGNGVAEAYTNVQKAEQALTQWTTEAHGAVAKHVEVLKEFIATQNIAVDSNQLAALSEEKLGRLWNENVVALDEIRLRYSVGASSRETYTVAQDRAAAATKAFTNELASESEKMDSLVKKETISDWKDLNKALGDNVLLMKGLGAAMDALKDPSGGLAKELKTLGIDVGDGGRETLKLVAAFESLAAKGNASLDVVEAAWAKVSKQVEKLGNADLPAAKAAMDSYIGALVQANAPIGQIYVAQEKELELEAKLNQERGEGSAAQLVALTNLQMKTQALKDLSAGLGTIYQGLGRDFQQTFTVLGTNVSSAISGAQTWAQAWKKSTQEVAQMFLTTLINGALKLAVSAILAQVPALAAVTVAHTTMATTAAATDATLGAAVRMSTVAGEAAVAAASAIAAYAGIPFVGPALGAAAAAAYTAAIMALVPAAGAEGGFDVGAEAPITQLHPREMVLPADIAGGMRNLIRGVGNAPSALAAASGSPSGGVVMNNPSFHGYSVQNANDLMDAVVQSGRRAGVNW